MQNWRINCWPIYEKDSSYKCWAISFKDIIYETFLDTNGDPNMNNITTNTFGCMHQIGLTFVWVVNGLSKAAIAWLLTWVWMTVTRWWLTGDGDSADDDYREEEGVRRVMLVMMVMMTVMMISQGSEGGRDCMTELSLEALAEDHMLLFANHHHQ